MKSSRTIGPISWDKSSRSHSVCMGRSIRKRIETFFVSTPLKISEFVARFLAIESDQPLIRRFGCVVKRTECWQRTRTPVDQTVGWLRRFLATVVIRSWFKTSMVALGRWSGTSWMSGLSNRRSILQPKKLNGSPSNGSRSQYLLAIGLR